MLMISTVMVTAKWQRSDAPQNTVVCADDTSRRHVSESGLKGLHSQGNFENC